MVPKITHCKEAKPAGTMPVHREILFQADAHDFNWIRVDANVAKPPHPYDSGDSFMMIVAGNIDLNVDGQTYPMQAGDVAHIPQGAVRGFTTGPEGATIFAAHLGA
jgi:glyoxylate utilization-related uncharacterized protein